MRTPSIRDAVASATVALAALALAACTAAPLSAPTHGAAAPAHVQTSYPATVLDDGTGPKLCLGGIRESYPPQCGGPAVIGWDWANWAGSFDEASGVRWGEFWLAGIYDPAADSFTMQIAEARADHDWSAPAHDNPDYASPCPEPEGGWRVENPALTNWLMLENALRFAPSLEGFAGAWIDQSLNPVFGTQPDVDDEDALNEYERGINDTTVMILNVATTGDIVRTEEALRERWGGMLCVSAAARSQAELMRIQNNLPAHGVLMAWIDITRGHVRVEVTYDDGTLQQSLDAQYGKDVVRVNSALIPWSAPQS